MALIVADGTNYKTANAYVSVADADAYHTLRGNAAWTGDNQAKEDAIIRATDYMDSLMWMGLRRYNRDQLLDWPRSGVYDDEGNTIKDTEIPREIPDACAEIALREIVTPGVMQPDVVSSQAVSREKIDVIELQYAKSAMSPSDVRPQIADVAKFIVQYLAKGGARNELAGKSVRA